MIHYLRNQQNSPMASIVMGLISCAMMLWGVDKIFQKLPDSQLANMYTSTASQEANRIYRQILHNNHGSGQPAPTNEELIHYQQVATVQAQHHIKKRALADDTGLLIHPFVIKEVATQTGILTSESQQPQQLRTQLELLHQHARRLMLDEALTRSAIEDETTKQASKHLFNARKVFQWVAMPTIDKDYYKSYQPSKKEIETAYQASPFQEEETLKVSYISIPKSTGKHTIDTVLEQLLLTPNNLDALAAHYQVKIKNSANFTQSKGNKQDASQFESFRQHVFQSTHSLNRLHDPVELPNGNIIVFKKTNHNKGTKKPLSIVKKDIIHNLKQQHATAHQTSIIKKLHHELVTKKTSLKSIAKKYNLTLKHSEWLSADTESSKTPKPIQTMGFNIIPNNHQGDAHSEHVLADDAKTWYLFNTEQVKFIDKDDADTNTKSHGLLTQLELNHLMDNLSLS